MAYSIHDTFDQSLRQAIATQALRRILERKLAAANVPPDREVLDHLMRHIREKADGPITVDDKYAALASVDFRCSPAELEDAVAECEKQYNNLDPGDMWRLLHKATRPYIDRLKRDWPERHAEDLQRDFQFRRNLENRWAEGLSKLRMMLTISRELGRDELAKYRRDGNPKSQHKTEALFRLHARACQVSAEIISLMEGGFADGAMARWRTLFEIVTVAALVEKHDNDLAERYLDHNAVEEKKAADMYVQCYGEAGIKAYGVRQLNEIDHEFKLVLQLYGDGFKGEYGWAAQHIGVKKPNFFDIVDAVGDGHMKSSYKLASLNVHAGVRGIEYKHGALNKLPMLAGSSNAGLEEPGKKTAHSLARVTQLLIGKSHILDDQVHIEFVADLMDEACAAFVRASEKLTADDAKLRQKRRRQQATSVRAMRRTKAVKGRLSNRMPPKPRR